MKKQSVICSSLLSNALRTSGQIGQQKMTLYSLTLLNCEGNDVICITHLKQDALILLKDMEKTTRYSAGIVVETTCMDVAI